MGKVSIEQLSAVKSSGEVIESTHEYVVYAQLPAKKTESNPNPDKWAVLNCFRDAQVAKDIAEQLDKANRLPEKSPLKATRVEQLTEQQKQLADIDVTIVVDCRNLKGAAGKKVLREFEAIADGTTTLVAGSGKAAFVNVVNAWYEFRNIQS